MAETKLQETTRRMGERAAQAGGERNEARIIQAAAEWQFAHNSGENNNVYDTTLRRAYNVKAAMDRAGLPFDPSTASSWIEQLKGKNIDGNVDNLTRRFMLTKIGISADFNVSNQIIDRQTDIVTAIQRNGVVPTAEMVGKYEQIFTKDGKLQPIDQTNMDRRLGLEKLGYDPLQDPGDINKLWDVKTATEQATGQPATKEMVDTYLPSLQPGQGVNVGNLTSKIRSTETIKSGGIPPGGGTGPGGGGTGGGATGGGLPDRFAALPGAGPDRFAGMGGAQTDRFATLPGAGPDRFAGLGGTPTDRFASLPGAGPDRFATLPGAGPDRFAALPTGQAPDRFAGIGGPQQDRFGALGAGGEGDLLEQFFPEFGQRQQQLGQFALQLTQDILSGNLPEGVMRGFVENVRAAQGVKGLGVSPLASFDEAIAKSGFQEQFRSQQIGQLGQIQSIMGQPFQQGFQAAAGQTQTDQFGQQLGFNVAGAQTQADQFQRQYGMSLAQAQQNADQFQRQFGLSVAQAQTQASQFGQQLGFNVAGAQTQADQFQQQYGMTLAQAMADQDRFQQQFGLSVAQAQTQSDQFGQQLGFNVAGAQTQSDQFGQQLGFDVARGQTQADQFGVQAGLENRRLQLGAAGQILEGAQFTEGMEAEKNKPRPSFWENLGYSFAGGVGSGLSGGVTGLISNAIAPKPKVAYQ